MSDKLLRTRLISNEDRTEAIIAVLQAEVRAWRNWRKLVVRYMTCEQPDPTVKIDALKAAIEATDAAEALEEPGPNSPHA